MSHDLSALTIADWKTRTAAAFAVGAAGYLLSMECTYTDVERLAHLGDVIADLRAALDLTPVTGTEAPAHSTQTTKHTDNVEGGGRL